MRLWKYKRKINISIMSKSIKSSSSFEEKNSLLQFSQ